jgi:uncharacterized protein YjdB
MTFKHKLSARLALLRNAAVVGAAAAIVACELGDRSIALDQSSFVPSTSLAPADTVFAEDFESGTLNAWQDGVDATRHKVVTDAAGAQSGSRYLDVTYPAGSDGGWLTRFFMPGYDSLYVSYYVRLPANWQGTTKLIAFYGSRTDNQWSAFGQAGKCPTGTDFFAAMLVSDPVGDPGFTRFYSYYPAMAREADGVTCWGRFGDGRESYLQQGMSLGVWHHVEYWVKLNTPGQANSMQTFWVDGVQQGTWSGLSFRSSTILTLNSVQLTFSNGGSPQTEHFYVDNLVVSSRLPGTDTSVAPVALVAVSPASTTLTVGQTLQLAAAPQDAIGNILTDRAITWTSGAPAVATVSASGLVTALAAGSATITASSEGVSGVAGVAVASPMTVPGRVSDLAVSGTTDTSVTLSFTEVGNGTDGAASYDVRYAAGALSWPSASSVVRGSCATPVVGTAIGAQRTCTVSGLAGSTAYQFQLVAFRGTLDVNAVFGELSNIASGTTTTTAPGPVASVAIRPATASIGVGATRQLTATLTDAAGNVLTGRPVTWTSSNTGVATVSASGLVKAASVGSATITATSEGVGGATAITATAVKPGRVTTLAVVGTTDSSVTLSFTEVRNGVGGPASYDVRYAADTIIWSSATSVTRGSCATAVVGTAVGANLKCTVMGLAASQSYQFQVVALRGTLDIDAVFGALSNIASGTTSAGPTVPVASVAVTPATVSQVAGTMQQLSAVLKDAAGNVVTGRAVTWTSSAPAVASVNGTGLETSLAAGTATITATSEGNIGTAAITVTAPAVTNPGTVGDLAVASATDTSVTLSFTEVSNGAGQAAQYDVRYSAGAMSWPAAASVTRGTCTTPVAGGAIGADRTCAVVGLARSTGYQFQLVAFRGTLDLDAVFGGLSNVASGSTLAGVPSTASVASVTVSPASMSLTPGGTQQLTATLKDASGNTLSGRSVSWTSSAPLVASVSSNGLASGLAVGTTAITATSEGVSNTAAITITTGGGGSPLNEPAGFRALNDQPWSLMTGSGWNYLRRTSSKDDGIVVDLTAPRSAADVLRIVFTTDMAANTEPSVHWMGLPGVREIYTVWWMKISPNWQSSPAGAGKITFLFTNGAGQVYTGLYHQGGDPTSGWVTGPPYRIGVNTEWAPYGQRVWLPNATTTFINPGQWHRVEVYYRWSTTSGAADGIIRWWVDGALNGNYTNVQYPSGSFTEFQYAPTLQNPPTAELYMHLDHTYVSVP